METSFGWKLVVDYIYYDLNDRGTLARLSTVSRLHHSITRSLLWSRLELKSFDNLFSVVLNAGDDCFAHVKSCRIQTFNAFQTRYAILILKRCINARRLSVASYFDRVMLHSLNQALIPFKQLACLDLSKSWFTCYRYDLLEFLSQVKTTTVVLQGIRFSGSSYDSVMSLPWKLGNSQVEVLDLSYNIGLQSIDAIDIIQLFPNLKSLAVRECLRITDELTHFLGIFFGNKLQTLDISCTDTTYDSLQVINTKLPVLRSLFIGPAAMFHLLDADWEKAYNDLLHKPSLVQLHLRSGVFGINDDY
jgi:hypothetical protein